MEAAIQEELKQHRDWDRKTKEILAFREEWKKIGRASKEEAEAVWERFRKGCDEFFEKKRAFYEAQKKDYDVNKQAKTKIIEQAEAAQNSTDWEKTSKFLIGLQRQWENIGPAGLYKADQALRNRFRAACNTFFDAWKKHSESLETEKRNNLAKREEIIKKLEELAPSVVSADAMPTIKTIAKEWDEAGEIPVNLREDVFGRYTRALDSCYEKMGMNDKDKEMLKYGSRLERMKHSNNGERLLEDERRFIRNKIRTIEDEIAKTENNMGFFAKSSKVDALLQDIMKGVEQSKEQLASFRKKLEMIEKNLPKKVQMR